MKSSMIKTTVREIRESLGRYMAILAIVALGVGFFVGLKVTRPAMLDTAGRYLEEKELYDLRLISTLGFDETDMEQAARQEGVKVAEGEVSIDFLAVEEDGIEKVLRAHSILRVQNQTEVTLGRKPRYGNECMVDAQVYGRDAIGQTIRVSENNGQDTKDMLRYQEYTIVGLCNSSYYINFERGTTSLGNGKIKGFVYIPEDGFDTDYYTDLYLRLDQQFPLYSEEYEALIQEAEDWAEPFCEELGSQRYERLVEDARWQIEDGERQLARQTAEAEAELAEAEAELAEGEAELADAQAQIDDGWRQLREGRAEIAENSGKLADSRAELADGQSQIDDGIKELEEKKQEAQELTGEEREAMEGGLKLAEAQVKGRQAQVQAGQAQADMGQAQMDGALANIARQEEKLREAQEELEEGRKELEDGREELADAREELAEEAAKAEKELADARKELDELEEPDTYVLTRDENIGYACFENDSDIVEAVAGVFPIFFFLVAALVCVTTMTRMVEEGRTQIGVMKALGYGRAAIMGKYLFYSGSAAVIGGAVGFLAGSFVFPTVIWAAYGIMYRAGELALTLHWGYALAALAASVLCSMGTTFLTCRYELGSMAAQLMRPKAPKSGKRILLERIPFLWNRMKFLVKVSARNIFRYKQRFYMMVFGIGGCTALLLTGFGLKDSIQSLTDAQYGRIQIGDMTVMFASPEGEADRSGFLAAMEQSGGTYTSVFEESADVKTGETAKSATLVIPRKPQEAGTYLDLHTPEGEPLPWPREGEAVLTQKMAKKLGAGPGDQVEVEDADHRRFTVTVSGVSENFIDNYIYLSPQTWEAQTGESPAYKSAYVALPEGTDAHQAAAVLMNCEEVASVSVYADMETRMESMIQSLDYVVLLIIVCAGALAFIVLYNLTNINITERLREIATIKVLGFYARETAQYVFRENHILTAIGSLAGLVMGKYLHRFVMDQIDVDMVSFDVHIAPLSVVYSVALTFLFAAVVNRVMRRKLDRINMAESMKSIE